MTKEWAEKKVIKEKEVLEEKLKRSGRNRKVRKS